MIVWLGLYLSLNYTTPVWFTPTKPAVEATALVGIHKAVLSVIYVQPVAHQHRPLYSVGIGFRVF